MKLAVKKELGNNPLGGFHYLMIPKPIENEQEAQLWRAMGLTIIEVSDDKGDRLLREAGSALSHQYEVAVLAEKAISKEKSK